MQPDAKSKKSGIRGIQLRLSSLIYRKKVIPLTHLRLGTLSDDKPLERSALQSLFIKGSSQESKLNEVVCPNVRSLTLMWKFNVKPKADERSIFVVLERFPLLEELIAHCSIVFQRSGPQNFGIRHVRLLEGMGVESASSTQRITSSDKLHKFLVHIRNITTFGSNSESIIDNLTKVTAHATSLPRLDLEGDIDLPYDLPPLSPISNVMHLRFGRMKPNSPFECDVDPLKPPLVKKIFHMLAAETRATCASQVSANWNWPKLEKLELIGLGMTKQVVNILLEALRYRSGCQQAQPSRPQACSLTLSNCWITTENGEDHIPLSDGVDMDYQLASKALEITNDIVV
jgi:hypothetical protein